MKKVITAATNRVEKLQTVTIGLDLGDRCSHYCVLDEDRKFSSPALEFSQPVLVRGNREVQRIKTGRV